MSRVTVKYQITIPVEICSELGIVPGTEVYITKEGIIIPIKKFLA